MTTAAHGQGRMAARKPLIAGNWKMYGRRASLDEIGALWTRIQPLRVPLDVVVCPPLTYVADAVDAAKNTGMAIGAQDCSASADDAARTGEVSASMIADLGARYVIVGHSERRAGHGETSPLVRDKAQAALAAGLIPIICVGETHEQREAGKAADVVAAQVSESTPSFETDLVIAYEPVWAIGAHITPSISEIADIHGVVRKSLSRIVGGRAALTRVLYGGSVSPQNAASIFVAEGVDGALVGRASLKAADFAAIILGYPATL